MDARPKDAARALAARLSDTTADGVLGGPPPESARPRPLLEKFPRGAEWPEEPTPLAKERQTDRHRDARKTERADYAAALGSDPAMAKALVVVRGPFLGRKFDIPDRGLVIGRGPECDIVVGTATDGTSRRHAQLRFVGGIAVVEDLESTNGLIVNKTPCHRSDLKPGDMLQVGSTLFKAIGDGEELRFHEMMYEMVVRDALTGLFNRTHLEMTLGQEFSRARRYGAPLSIVLMDVDHFKRINDTHTHIAGDQVLAEFGRLISNRVRGHDLPCRYGGDEFLILLPKTDLVGAVTLAERLAADVRSLRLKFADKDVPLTTSVGVAALQKDMERPETLILAADEALYASKKAGRNRVSCSTSDGGSTRPLPAFRMPD